MNKYAFQKDWEFYTKNRHQFNFCGCIIPNIEYDENGASAMEAFYTFDSQGKWIPCREPDFLKEIWICKKSINLHIKMWATGYNDMMIGIPDLINSFIDPPKWVEISLKKQIHKENLQNHLIPGEQQEQKDTLNTPLPINLINSMRS